MKKHITTISILLILGFLAVLNLSAQTPGAMTFQAEARDDKGGILKETTLNVTISFQVDTANNISIYEESHEVTTDKFGLFTIVLGNPQINDGHTIIIDDLNSLPWGVQPIFLRPFVTYKGVTSDMGPIEILSTPYAFYSSKAKFAGSATEVDWAGITNMPFDFADGMDHVDDADADPTNEIQDLSITNDKLIITNNDEATEIDLLPYKSVGNNPGDMQYWDGENWIMIPSGSDGQVLTMGNGIPQWTTEITPVPNISTLPISNVTSISASCGGNIDFTGGFYISEKGICWSTTPDPTIDLLTKTNEGEGGGQFESSITNLTGNANYYVRAYAKYSLGVVYGEELQFSTSQSLTVSTGPVSDIRQEVAYVEGTILSDGGVEITELGICYSTSPNPIKGDYGTYRECTSSFDPETNKFGTNIGLTTGRNYYTRAYAINSGGIVYGQEVEFNTLPAEIPTVITYSPYAIRSNKTLSGGEIVYNGGANITERGLLYQLTAIDPDLASRTYDDDCVGSRDDFLCEMTELTPLSVYAVQAYATNRAGTGYGEVHFFTPTPICTDVEGNEYNTIQIGGQTWLADNLETTKYNNGLDIGTNVEISSDDTGARYTGHAVNTHILCPAGWHVPNNEEWQTLQDHAAGIANGNHISMVLKDRSLYTESYHYWYNTWPYINETGFSGIGTSIIGNNEEIFFWSSDESVRGGPGEHYTGGYRYELAPSGLYKWSCDLEEDLAVRCVKD